MRDMSSTDKRRKVSDDDILAEFRSSDDGFRTAPELAEILGMTRQGVHARLQRLEERGLVEQRKINATTGLWKLQD